MVRAVGPVSRPEGLVIRPAGVEEIFALRHAVLRPDYPVERSVYAEDADAVHIGGWSGEVVVGCATVFPDPWPGPPPVPTAWRLRGMAVEPAWQGRGVGADVLAAAVVVARDAGAPLLWANGRTTALPFYQRHGWVVAGAEFIASDSGLPHFPIVLDLANT
jgi:GNAT superfamily N-acetyltransferase